MNEKNHLSINCPDCKSEIVIDTVTGKILFHKKAKEKSQAPDFSDLLKGLDKRKTEVETFFDKEQAALKDRDRLMEEKFKAALDQAKTISDDDVRLRPFDLD